MSCDKVPALAIAGQKEWLAARQNTVSALNIPLRAYLDLLYRYLLPQRRKVALLCALMAGQILLQVYNPQILRRFIDAAVAGGSASALLKIAGLFVVLSVGQQLAAAAARYSGEDVGWSATNMLRNDLAAHCLGLDMAFHKEHSPGQLIERVDGDVNTLSTFFSRFVVGMLSNLVLLIGILAALFIEDWRVGLGLSVFVVATMGVLALVRQIAVRHWEAVRGYSARFFGFLTEQLSGTEDIRGNGAEGYVLFRLHGLFREWLPLHRRAEIAGYGMWVSSLAVIAIGNAVAFAISLSLWRSGSLTIGTVYLIYHYTQMLRRPMEQIRTQLQEMQRAAAGIGRVRRLLDTKPTIVDGTGGRLPDGPLAVQFAGVQFAYADGDGDEAVLSDIDFVLPPGQVLGLLGRTGSGKTTLARLLLRLYDPRAGQIRLGDVDLPGVPVADVRNRVGFVTQDVQLFAGTVRDNLTFFDSSISDATLSAAIGELGLTDWLKALPAGLDTMLASGGRGLSAGEAQLLAFARLLLRNPGLVVLDEASSRLDPATEDLLERAVSRLLSGRTAIIIAHRLATVERADSVMILERGRIAEYGRRADLAADPTSRFARLLRTGLEDVLA
jgi:ATP-binding cassette subfamily B protein